MFFFQNFNVCFRIHSSIEVILKKYVIQNSNSDIENNTLRSLINYYIINNIFYVEISFNILKFYLSFK